MPTRRPSGLCRINARVSLALPPWGDHIFEMVAP
jgi:hypothetical protein